MTRREAIAALVALPPATEVRVAAVRPTDVIIVSAGQPISTKTADHLKALVQQVWPDHRVLVLGDDLKLTIARGVDG